MSGLRWALLVVLAICAVVLILQRQQRATAPHVVVNPPEPQLPLLPPAPVSQIYSNKPEEEVRRSLYPSDIPVASSRAEIPNCTRVLMIGNSYSFYNAMPWLLEAFSERDAKPWRVTVVAYPNLAFTDHRRAGAELFIREKKWDFVILQDYSLGPLIAGEAFHEDGAALVREVKAAGATPILYQTWARESNPQSQQILSAQYATLAKTSGARVARVGDAWALLLKQEKPPALYDFDGSHPTLEGSYTAACVIYAAISGRSPVGLPRTVAPPVRKSQTWVMADGAYDLSAETAAAIQAAAESVGKTSDTAPAP